MPLVHSASKTLAGGGVTNDQASRIRRTAEANGIDPIGKAAEL